MWEEHKQQITKEEKQMAHTNEKCIIQSNILSQKCQINITILYNLYLINQQILKKKIIPKVNKVPKKKTHTLLRVVSIEKRNSSK